MPESTNSDVTPGTKEESINKDAKLNHEEEAPELADDDSSENGSSCVGPVFDASGGIDDAKGGGRDRGGPSHVDGPPDKRTRADSGGATSAKTGQCGSEHAAVGGHGSDSD